MTSFSKHPVKMHTGLFILSVLCLCTAEVYHTPSGTTMSNVPEDDRINDVDHDVQIPVYNPKSSSYSQSRISTPDLISTRSLLKADSVDTTTMSDITQTPYGLLDSRYAPDKQLTKGQTMNADQPKSITSAIRKEESDEDVLRTSDINSKQLKIVPDLLSRVKHQESNKNMPQLDTENPSIATDEAEPGTVQDEVDGGDGEQFTPTLPTDEDESTSPQPPPHNGRVDIKINIPHIFHLSLGDTGDGRRQLGIQAPFFRLDLSRPRFKVFKK